MAWRGEIDLGTKPAAPDAAMVTRTNHVGGAAIAAPDKPAVLGIARFPPPSAREESYFKRNIGDRARAADGLLSVARACRSPAAAQTKSTVRNHAQDSFGIFRCCEGLGVRKFAPAPTQVWRRTEDAHE